MPRRHAYWIGRAFALSVLFAAAPLSAHADEPTAAQLEFFEKKVRPVLVEHCYQCHSVAKKSPSGDLRLDGRAHMLEGTDNGPVLVPGQPRKSRIIEAVTYKHPKLKMPPKGKLPDAAIADLTAWVAMGAPWPRESSKTYPNKVAFDLAKRKQEHWAWQPLKPQQPPTVQDKTWPTGPVDAFLLAKLEAKGLKPAAATDRRTLLRRLHFDLIGLPPTPAEVNAFVADQAPNAVEKVVDQLLASPRFGERWGRHWLDLVRYAESRGHEFDYTLPNAYQYRDYVIRAFNADVPYDQFLHEHLAGDLLPKPRLHPTEKFNESILGTGFFFLGEQIHSPVDICQDHADRLDNMIDVTTKAFLGLTVACARCHDHKFDAISTKDYYALSGVLQSGSYRLAPFDTLEHNRRVAANLWKLRAQTQTEVQRELAAQLKPGIERTATYLLAAREALSAKDHAAVAKKHKVDEVLLARWVTHLRAAAKNPDDLLHVWSQAAQAKVPADALKQVRADYRKRDEATPKPVKADVVVDYDKDNPEDWLPDGPVFGIQPVRIGFMRFSSDPARPVVGYTTRSAAERDPVWPAPKLAPGTENESGALGGLLRAGRTLRTPTFQVKTGKVYLLVKGEGMSYAAVEGHVMLSGPLHGSLIKNFKAGPDFQWVVHDLTPYKGRRAHLEFTPRDGGEFAVAKVVQADATPWLGEQTNQVMALLLGVPDPDTHEALADRHLVLFAAVRDFLSTGLVAGGADDARVFNWLLKNSALFVKDEAAFHKAIAATAAPLFAGQAKLLAQVKTTTRLAPAMLDANGVDENVFNRGNYKTPGPKVPRRFLEAFSGPEPLPVTQGSGRLELAQLMTDPARTPLVPRVLVNRVWHHLFGRGIVASTDNFGVLGEAPTHPELLDTLADQFVKDGWSVKKLIRTLVLTKAYQQSSKLDKAADEADPQNLLLHRMRLRRLEGEAIRDAMLTVSGRLDLTAFGPAVPVHLTPFQDGRGRPGSGPLDGNGRRSVYLSVRRNFLPAMLLAFDTPIPFSTVGTRTVSNVPAQALILMNDPFVRQQADLWAKRVCAQVKTPEERVSSMYLSAFARSPAEAELQACLAFVTRQAKLDNRTAEDAAVWASLAHALYNTKEFIYLP